MRRKRPSPIAVARIDGNDFDGKPYAKGDAFETLKIYWFNGEHWRLLARNGMHYRIPDILVGDPDEPNPFERWRP